MTVYYEEQNVLIRDSEFSDIDALKGKLKKADIDEVKASHNFTPEEALRNSFNLSTMKFTFLYKNKVIGMFGIRPESLVSNVAIVWMLTSDEIENMKLRFLRLSRIFLGVFRSYYPVLVNHVDIRHKSSIAWLEWMGAKFMPSIKIGLRKMEFLPFQFGGQ